MTQGRKVGLVHVALLSLFGCREAPKDEKETRSGPPVASVARPPAASGVEERADRTTEHDRARVSKFVESWLAAQNDRDFSAYEKLYAERFTGIKRSGPRVRAMDRRAWLSDRKTMFEKPFSVTAANSIVARAGSLLSFTFEQTWQSENYRDSGKKQLLLTVANDGLSIVREEMLASNILNAPAILSMPFERGTLGENLDGHFALLTSEAVNLEWLEGHPEYVGENLARREVALRTLAPALRDKLEFEFEVFDSSGKSCRVRPARFDVFARVEPHFGMRSDWEDGFAVSEGRSPKKVPLSQRAHDLWSLALNHPTGTGLKLALVLEKSPECSKPIWGRKFAAEAPKPWAPRSLDAAETLEFSRALAGRAKLRDATKVAREEGSVGGEASWSDGKGKFVTFEGPTGECVRIAELHGAGGCSYSTPTSLTFVDAKLGKDFVEIAAGSEIGESIEGAVDFDGDGRPELITKSAIYRITKSGLEIVLDHSKPSYECPC